jgi:ABC-2 type transport system ATP-binding protein
VLTTQYLEEADQLANRITVINRGQVIANGTPEELKTAIDGDRIELVLHSPADLGRAAEIVEHAVGVPVSVDEDGRRISAPVREHVLALTGVVRALDDAGIRAADIRLRRPTLDEALPASHR